MKGISAFLLCLSTVLAQAQNIYVSQNGAGAANGADAADAYALTWLNTPANWGTGPTQAGPGTTVHLVGTLTNTLTTYGGGTPGNPLTIHFEPNAMFSAPTLPPLSKWITIMGGANNLVIDGGVNGLMQLTDNGTVRSMGGTCTYSNTAIFGIFNVNLATNVVIQNLTISNLYNRQTNTDMTDNALVLSEGIAVWGGSGANPAGWTMSNCVISGLHHPISCVFDSSGYSNCIITRCVITNYAYGIGISPTTIGAKFYNVIITHNAIQAGDMFENNANWHRNGIVSFGVESDSATSICISNFVIAYNNIGTGFHPCLTCPIVSGGSSLMSFQQDLMEHVRVYNNIETVAPGIMVGGEYLWGNDFLYANNTIVSWTSNGIGGVGGDVFIPLMGNSNVFAFNNIVCNSRKMVVTTVTTNTVVTAQDAANVLNQNNVQAGYNVFNGNYASTGQSCYQITIYTNNFNGALIYSPYGYDNLVDTMVEWPTVNLWSNTTVNNVQMDASFVPLSTDTVAVGKGTNLTSWGITDDYAGNPRPATGNWTIGAYQTTDSTTTNSISIFSVGAGSGGTGSGGAGNGVGGSTVAGISSFVAGGGGSDITNGLILRWKFAEGSGRTAADSSGNGNAGTLMGTTTWTNGLAGTSAVLFPTNDGALSSPNAVVNTTFNYTGDWTITVWVNNTSVPGVINTGFCLGGYATLFTRCQSSGWGLQDASGLVKYYAGNTLQNDAWYFLAVSKASGANYQFYLNGLPAASATGSDVNPSAAAAGSNGQGSSGMVGAVADCRVFNRVLSASEISVLAANGPNAVAGTGPLAPANFHVVSTSQ